MLEKGYIKEPEGMKLSPTRSESSCSEGVRSSLQFNCPLRFSLSSDLNTGTSSPAFFNGDNLKQTTWLWSQNIFFNLGVTCIDVTRPSVVIDSAINGVHYGSRTH